MGLSTAILAVCLGAAVVGGAVAEVLHRRADRLMSYLGEPARPAYSGGEVGTGAAALVVALVAGIVAIHLRYALGMFGVAHVAYLVVTAAVPAFGLWVAARCWIGRLRTGVRSPGRVAALGLVLAVPAAFGLWSSYVAPFDLGVDEADLVVEDGPPDAPPLRIAVVADVQTDRIGTYEHDAIDRVMATEPDLVVVVGDLFQGDRASWEQAVPDLTALLSELSAPGGVFVVPGNVDEPDLLREAATAAGATYLENDIAATSVAGRDVTIGGVEFHYAREEPGRTIDELESIPGGVDDVRILLAHSPDAVTELAPDSTVDLVVSGHTHGGQVRVPGFGLPFTAVERVPDSVAGGGLSRFEGHEIYVSTGIGMERGQAPQVRIGVPPTFGLLTIR